MRSEKEIKDFILDFATKDDRVRTVILNGSRANPNVKPDNFQDFDVVFIVENFDNFIAESNWIDFLGEIVVKQFPDDMFYGNVKTSETKYSGSYSYLMLFKDGNRIDLSIVSKHRFQMDYHLDSLSIVWLDKDGLLNEIPPSNDKDYHIKRPAEKEFRDTCNEFWWVSTYVAKGLLRKEITYAKEMLERIVRPMFMRIVEWKVGIDTNFSVSFGKAGRNMKQYLSVELYEDVIKTYSSADTEKNWESLFILTDLFTKFSNEIAEKLNFEIDIVEQKNTSEYLKHRYEDCEKISIREGIANR